MRCKLSLPSSSGRAPRGDFGEGHQTQEASVRSRGSSGSESPLQALLAAQDSAGSEPPFKAEPPGLAPALGIDLGTTYARVGVWQGGDVSIIANEKGNVSMPCWLAFTDAGVLVGEDAREQAVSNIENTIFAPQRLMGFRIDSPWVRWYSRFWPSQMVRGEDDRPLLRVSTKGQEQFFRPEDLVAMLLSSLRRSAERKLGRRVMDACVTVPSEYGQMQREAMVEACRGARLNVIALIKAPTAGAIAYSLTNVGRAVGNVLVCDMGSTYFDFALLTVTGGKMTERACGTDYMDFDSHLVQFCQEDLREKWGISVRGDQKVMLRLQRACEAAKRHLSTYSRACVDLKGLTPHLDYSCVIARSGFEERCRDDMEARLDAIADCLEDCGLEKSDVREVVLVGGSATIPVLKRVISEFFHGIRPIEVVRPEHAAVLGATSFAAAVAGRRDGEVPVELKHLEVVEVCAFPMLPNQGEADGEVSSPCRGKPAGRTASSPAAVPAAAPDVGVFPPKPRTRAYFKELPRAPSLQEDTDALRPSGDFCSDGE